MSTTNTGGSISRRVIGVILIVVGVVGVVLAIGLIVVGTQFMGGIGTTINSTLTMVTDTMNTTKAALEQTKSTVVEVTNGLDNVQKTVVDTGETVKQADALFSQAMTITSQDIPDTLDEVNAILPSTAATTQALLGNVETAMVDASAIVDQNGPFVNQALAITTQDVPDTLDQVHAAIPPAAETTKSLLSNVEMTMADTAETIDQADAAVKEIVRFTSQDVPATLDLVHAYIPPAAETAQTFLTDAEQNMVIASLMVDQADAVLNQAFRVVGYDVPNTIDYVNAYIPPTADVAKAALNDTEAAMVNASAMTRQAGAMLDQAVSVASNDVPYTLDVVNAYIPPTAGATQAFLESLKATLDNAGTTVDQTEVALDVTSQIVAGQVPDTLDQLNDTLPSIMYATEGNLNATLALLSQMNLLDANYRVDVDQPADQISANLDYLSQQLRAMDYYLSTDLGLVDEGLSAMSVNVGAVNDQIDQLETLTVQLDQVSDQLRFLDELYDANMDLEATSDYIVDLSENVDAINLQIDGFVAMTDQLDLVSDQLRGLDDLYDQNVDLETASQMILNLSENTAAVNKQIDDFVLLAGQLEVLSDQLRALEPYTDFPTEAISQDIMALSQDVGAINNQVDEFVKLSGQLEVLSSQLRAMEPYAEVDYEAISRNLLALSQDMGAINQQIGELVKLTPQLEALSSQLRTLEPYIDDVSLAVIGDDIIVLSEDVAAINAQAKGFIPLVDEYIAVVDELNASVSQVQANLDRQLGLARTVIIIAAIWILLAQLTPLYLGWELVAGRRDRGPVDVSAPPPEPAPEA
jgi:hypothetical protein